jgi:hypothetical protein
MVDIKSGTHDWDSRKREREESGERADIFFKCIYSTLFQLLVTVEFFVK